MALKPHRFSLIALVISVGASDGGVFSCPAGSESAECMLGEEHSLMQVPATLLSMSSKDWPARIAKVFSHRFDPVGESAPESEAQLEGDDEAKLVAAENAAETDAQSVEAGIQSEKAGIESEEAGIEGEEAEIEVAGVDVDIAEPWWEIESHLALAALALKDIGGADVTLEAQKVLSSLKNTTADVSGAVMNTVSESLINQTTGVLDAVKTSGVLSAVKNQTSGVLDAVKNSTESAMERTAGVLHAVKNSTESAIDRTAVVLDNVKNTTADALDKMKNKTAGMINATADVLDAVQNTTADILGDVSAGAQVFADAVQNISAQTIRIVRNTTTDLFEDISFLLDAVAPFLTPYLAHKHGMLVHVSDIAKVTGVRGEELAKAENSFQGDMVPEDTTQLLLFQNIAEGKNHQSVAAGRPWTKGIVNYCFASDVDKAVQAHFNASVEQVVKATCLTFVNVGWLSGDSSSDASIQRCNVQPAIFVQSRKDFGCYSVVGQSSLPSQQLQLQNPGCTTQGVILHEIGHSLGMAHEHARPDRDKFVTVISGNIQPQWRSAFVKQNESYTGLPYEYLSLMHYDQYAFSKDDGVLPTLKAAAGHDGEIGQRMGFAAADIEQLIEMYKHEVPGCSGRTIAGTGCVNMPSDDGGPLCTGLTQCGGGITNDRCCACGGGVEIQCYDSEICPSTPILPRENLSTYIVDLTPKFIFHNQSKEGDCVIHNTHTIELKFKCQATCTHTIGPSAFQSDFCQNAPVTQICTIPELCQVWDPAGQALYGDNVTVPTAGPSTAGPDTTTASTAGKSTAGPSTAGASTAGASPVAVQHTAVKEEESAESATFAPQPFTSATEDAGTEEEETRTKQQQSRTHQLLVGAAATCTVVLVGLTIHSFWAATVVAQ